MALFMNPSASEMPRWAENFAATAFDELVRARSREPFFPPSTGVPWVIVPYVDPSLVRVHAMYACKRALSPKALTTLPPEQFFTDWRKYCRAFVEATLMPGASPRLMSITCDGTRRAKKELFELGGLMPTLGELDNALGTSLQEAEARRFKRLEKFAEYTRFIMMQQPGGLGRDDRHDKRCDG
jgi:hypothetical protein